MTRLANAMITTATITPMTMMPMLVESGAAMGYTDFDHSLDSELPAL